MLLRLTAVYPSLWLTEIVPRPQRLLKYLGNPGNEIGGFDVSSFSLGRFVVKFDLERPSFLR